jgi:hypothetical protein
MPACDINSLLAQMASGGVLNLDDRATLLAIAGALSQQLGGVNAVTAVVDGKSFLKFDDRMLNAAIAAALCPS